MENQTNIPTPLSEVDELREQLALFKQRIDQQEIINDRLMRHTMNARISIFTKTSVILDVIGLLAMPLILLALHSIGAPWYLGILILLAVVIELTYNIICHRKIQCLFTEGNDLLTVRRGLLKFKKSERMQMLITVPLLLLWFVAFYWQMGAFDHELTGPSTRGLISSAVGIILGLLCCFGFFAWEMHRVNLSIREIDELSEDSTV